MAQNTENSVNTANPVMNTTLILPASAILPKGMMRPAIIREYAMDTHDTELVSVWKSAAMVGNATFTMLASMLSMRTPRTIVRISRPTVPFADMPY